MKTKSLKIVWVLLCLWVAKPSIAQIWRPLGEGFKDAPIAVTNDADYLYFAFVDSTTTNNGAKIFLVARWNGVFWQNISTFLAGPASNISSIATYKNQVYLGGFFDTVFFSTTRTGIIKLDGKKWVDAAKRYRNDASPVRISDLKVFGGFLYAAGNFSRIDTTAANGLARFNGIGWQGLEDFTKKDFAGSSAKLEEFNDTLFVSGAYKNKSTNTAIPLLKIKGNNLTADSTSPFETIGLLQGGKDELMAFGSDNASNKIIYSWKNGSWQDRTKNIPNLQTAAIRDVTFFDGEFWACGIVNIGGGELKHILKWTGSQWEHLGDLDLPNVRYIRQFRSKLFVSGGFIQYRRIRLNRVAEYDKDLALITGKVYFDKNNNCQQDIGEPPIPGQIIRLFNGLFVAFSDREGIYSFVVPKAGNYPITALPRKYWALSSCNPSQYTFSPSNQNAIIDSADFAFRIDDSVEDVSVKLLPNAGYRFRRGFTELYSLTYKNNGGKAIPTGKIRLHLDDSLLGFVAFPPPASVNNGIAEWNYNNFEPGEERSILFRGKVSSQNTQQIELQAEAVNTNDAFAQDNYDTLAQTVEDQTGLKGKFIFPEPTSGDSITIFPSQGQHEVEYLIRFENNTDDTVRQVIVVDTIDLNLSLEYIQELGASHPYSTQVVNLPPQLGKGVLIWTFDNINLPPNPTKSNDFTENRGHIRFKLRLGSQIEKGTLVVNKADVIYDFDTYEATNQVFCKVDDLVGIAKFTNDDNPLTVYPNPTNNLLNIELVEEDSYTLTVLDMQGRKCLAEHSFNSTTTQIDLSSLNNGIYYISIANNEARYFQKVVKH